MRVVGCLLLLSMTVLALLEPVESQEVGFFRGVYRGTRDMIRSYKYVKKSKKQVNQLIYRESMIIFIHFNIY